MTADEVRELFRYNAWANRRLFEAAGALPDEEYRRDLKSSFGGVHGTLAHIVGAEQLWLGRWLGTPPPALLQGKDVGSLAELRQIWEGVETERGRFLAALNDPRLNETVTIKPTTGGAFVHTLRETFLHTVEHSSYHRGQVVTLFRQLGRKPPSPSLNLIFYYRAQGLGARG